MENQIQKQEKNHSEIGKIDRIKNSVNDIKIRDLGEIVFMDDDQNPLKQLLKYLFVLTNLKPENYPNDLEKNVIFNFLSKNYGKYPVEELRVAFELAVERKLTPYMAKGDNVNHFQSFSMMWFSGIMAAYHEFKIAERQRLQVKKTTTFKESAPIGEDLYIMQQLYKPYKKFLSDGVYPWTNLDEGLLFAKLWKLGIIRLDKVEQEKIRLKCISSMRLPRNMSEKQKEMKIDSACRSRAFKDWVIDQSESLNDIETTINQKLKEKWLKLKQKK